MSKPNKAKIQTSGKQEPLNNAFAGAFTGLGPLPTGPEPSTPLQPAKAAPVKKGRVLLRRETAHRGGKAVVVIYDFDAKVSNEALEELARTLKKKLGVGGVVHEREVEIQGDKTAAVRSALEEMGYKVGGVR